ncbi:MAG: hypothetical protein J0H56_08575 [Micrococcales bacterium]|nr:hypothetical protein [Micrococcales bacterium]
MGDTERSKVGQTLELLRDTLADYVDAAMTNAYGLHWDQRLAVEDAKRRKSSRKLVVSKGDLSVMLKVIQHERIAPWASPKTYPDPRIRSFASEILTLRNLYSHGDDCVNEYFRLIDTSSRFLHLLNLSVPNGLASQQQMPPHASGGDPSILGRAKPRVPLDHFENEVARLGESGERAARLLHTQSEIYEALLAGVALGDTNGNKRVSDALSFLTEVDLLEADGANEGSTVLKVLATYLRFLLLTGLSRLLLQRCIFDELRNFASPNGSRTPQESAGFERVEILLQAMEQTEFELAEKLVQLARQLNDGDAIPNTVILLANQVLKKDPTIDKDAELRLTRDSVARARMLAAMDPGTIYETCIVTELREEGERCNDLGRSEEAIRAFARADEIIDRYPAADPNLAFLQDCF